MTDVTCRNSGTVTMRRSTINLHQARNVLQQQQQQQFHTPARSRMGQGGCDENAHREGVVDG